MPIRVVGKQSIHRGKFLFELLRNLKDFGVGRMVARNMYERYPEPCYHVVHRVKPEMDLEGRLGTAEAIQIFRGKDLGVTVVEGADLSDWKLIPKDMEEAYKNCIKPHIVKVEPPRIIPADVPFPPLLRKLHMEEARRSGQSVTEEPRLPLIIRRDPGAVRLQEGVEVPVGSHRKEANRPPHTLLPESIAGKLWLHNHKPKKS